MIVIQSGSQFVLKKATEMDEQLKDDLEFARRVEKPGRDTKEQNLSVWIPKISLKNWISGIMIIEIDNPDIRKPMRFNRRDLPETLQDSIFIQRNRFS